MTIELKAKKYGNSLGILLPKEAAVMLKVSAGDGLFLTEEVNGGMRITAQDPASARQMKIAASIINRYRNTLRELAK